MIWRLVRRSRAWFAKSADLSRGQVVAGALALGFVLAGLIFVADREAEHAADGRRALAQFGRDSGSLNCKTARLVSHVPALQFEGEPIKNFIGWTDARRDMLVVVRDSNICSAETQRLLEERVELDRQLLEELEP